MIDLTPQLLVNTATTDPNAVFRRTNDDRVAKLAWQSSITYGQAFMVLTINYSRLKCVPQCTILMESPRGVHTFRS